MNKQNFYFKHFNNLVQLKTYNLYIYMCHDKNSNLIDFEILLVELQLDFLPSWSLDWRSCHDLYISLGRTTCKVSTICPIYIYIYIIWKSL